MWFSHLAIDAEARELHHDLAIDASGFGQPSRIAAGLVPPPEPASAVDLTPAAWLAIAVLLCAGALAAAAVVARPRQGEVAG